MAQKTVMVMGSSGLPEVLQPGDFTVPANSIHLLADFTTTNTTATATNLAFAATANKSYNVRVWGHVKKDTAASGVKVGVNGPAGATITGSEFRGGGTYTTSLTNGEISALNTLGGSFATGIGIKVPFRMEFLIIIGATAGNVTIQFATVTSNLATMFAGTCMEWTESTSV